MLPFSIWRSRFLRRALPNYALLENGKSERNQRKTKRKEKYAVKHVGAVHRKRLKMRGKLSQSLVHLICQTRVCGAFRFLDFSLGLAFWGNDNRDRVCNRGDAV